MRPHHTHVREPPPLRQRSLFLVFNDPLPPLPPLLLLHAVASTMSYAPPYGGYDPYGNGSQQQQQHGYHEASQQHQQGPSFEGYNPAAARTNNNAYSFSPSALSAPASAAFLPRFIPGGLDYFTQQQQQQQQQQTISSAERRMPAVSSSSFPTPMMTFSTHFRCTTARSHWKCFKCTTSRSCSTC